MVYGPRFMVYRLSSAVYRHNPSELRTLLAPFPNFSPKKSPVYRFYPLLIRFLPPDSAELAISFNMKLTSGILPAY